LKYARTREENQGLERSRCGEKAHTLMKTSLLGIVESLFGCHHQQHSRVVTIRRRTYQVCVECGREFEYSWEGMHSTRPSDAKNVDAPPNTLGQVEASMI
jgi:hypothetical protein